MTNDSPTVHLLLELHESQYYRNLGRTWLERLMIKWGLIPPYPEEEIAAVWVLPPGQSSRTYDAQGIDITGPVSEPIARRVLDALRTAFEQLGFAVVIETEYP